MKENTNKKEVDCLNKCYPNGKNYGSTEGKGEACERNYLMCVEFCHRKVRSGEYPPELVNDHIRQFVCKE